MICLSVPVATWKSWEQISISRSLVGKPHTRSCLGQIFVAMTCLWSTWCSIGKGGIYTELQRFHWNSRSVIPNRTSTHCCWNPTTRTRSTLICEKSRLAVCMSFGTFPKLQSTTPRIGNPKVGSRRDESLIRKSKSQWLAEADGMFLVSVPRLFWMISRHSCTWISLEMPGLSIFWVRLALQWILLSVLSWDKPFQKLVQNTAGPYLLVLPDFLIYVLPWLGMMIPN